MNEPRPRLYDQDAFDSPDADEPAAEASMASAGSLLAGGKFLGGRSLRDDDHLGVEAGTSGELLPDGVWVPGDDHSNGRSHANGGRAGNGHGGMPTLGGLPAPAASAMTVAAGFGVNQAGVPVRTPDGRTIYWRIAYQQVAGREQRVYVPVVAPGSRSKQWKQKGMRWSRAKRIGVAGGIVGVLSVISIFAALRWWQHQIDPPGPPGSEVAIEIPQGRSPSQIADLLDEQGVISNASTFRYYIRLKGASGFKAGKYTMRKRESYGDVVAQLQKGAVVIQKPQLDLKIAEGLTLPQIAARVEQQLPGRSAKAFLDFANSGQVRSAYMKPDSNVLDGFLYPANYKVPEDATEKDVLEIMVKEFDTRARAAGIDQAQARVGLEPWQVVTAASLIEREAVLDEERPKIAAVIRNRLAKGMKLQIDATVVYAIEQATGEHKTSLLLSDLEIESLYNTYKYDGLPPGPIAVVRKESVAAVLNPDPGDYLFYVLVDKQGHHFFTSSEREFINAKNKAKADGVF